MSIKDAYPGGRFGLSFELFPPKTPESEAAMWRTVDDLMAFEPALDHLHLRRRRLDPRHDARRAPGRAVPARPARGEPPHLRGQLRRRAARLPPRGARPAAWRRSWPCAAIRRRARRRFTRSTAACGTRRNWSALIRGEFPGVRDPRGRLSRDAPGGSEPRGRPREPEAQVRRRRRRGGDAALLRQRRLLPVSRSLRARSGSARRSCRA